MTQPGFLRSAADKKARGQNFREACGADFLGGGPDIIRDAQKCETSGHIVVKRIGGSWIFVTRLPHGTEDRKPLSRAAYVDGLTGLRRSGVWQARPGGGVINLRAVNMAAEREPFLGRTERGCRFR